jgi:hypothetical protein
MGTAMTKGVVVEVLAHVGVGVNGIFHLIAQWDVNWNKFAVGLPVPLPRQPAE